MRVGEMKNRITIQQKNVQTGAVVDLSGNNYTDYNTVWAKVEYTSVKEMYKSDSDVVVNTLKFIIRHRTDIKNDMRIRFNNDYYEIKGIRPLTAKKMYIIIIAESVQHEGGE